MKLRIITQDQQDRSIDMGPCVWTPIKGASKKPIPNGKIVQARSPRELQGLDGRAK